MSAVALALTPESARGAPGLVASCPGWRVPQRSAWLAAPGAFCRRGAAETGAAPARSARLKVDGLRVQFCGLIAVNDVTLEARPSRIAGLIGPNDAGNTTTFNSCSGLNRPTRGHVLIDDHDLSRRAPTARARRGLGRTFQQMELFDSLTVRENAALGAEAGLAGANPPRHVLPRRADGRWVREVAARALESCDLTALADAPVGGLLTGQRRLVELARCFAGEYPMLLLDEPSSGLDRAETLRFGEILTSAVRERGVRGTALLIVEQYVDRALEMSDHTYLLDHGTIVFSGKSSELDEDAVIRGYLGHNLGDRDTAT